jgi:hypothetical protein
MWIALKAALKLALVRWAVASGFGKFLGLLVLLLPLAGVLKVIGLPLLIVLGLLAAPLILLLAAIGIPVLVALLAGGALLAVVGTVLTVGILAIKILVPIVLIVWFVRWIFSKRDEPGSAST